MTESEIQQLIQIQGPHHNCVLMRNNSGALPDKTGRIVRYGLGHTSAKSIKSSDLIGITTVVITPEMVGKTVGVFTAVEVKSEDFKRPINAREISQAEFVAWVKSRGGIAGICRSVDEFKQLMKDL